MTSATTGDTGAGDPATPTGTTTGTTGTTEPVPDYTLPGPYAVDHGSGSFVASCVMGYDTFTPQGHAPAAWVVLAHGLTRDRTPMSGLAEHVASWGLAVVTPDVCHETLADLDYDQNALDLQALGAYVGGGAPIVHAGHSAGAVSSFLAAAADPLAVGHVGLDLADVALKAASAAASMPVPAWGVLGEPELCNLWGDAVPVYDLVPDHADVRVIGADHCDFEDPTDLGCTLPCASGAGASAVVQPAIQGLVTAAALAISGEDPRGADLWFPGGAGYDALLASGVIEQP